MLASQHQNLLEELTRLLETDPLLVSEGKLLKNKIIELTLAMDASLIKKLLGHESIKKHFFADADGVLVFDKIKFQQFVSNKSFLPDSYTAFKNKIGLTAEGSYLTDSKEVVLAWPYKDCVLEGGQTKDDAERDEVFWNETLAPDQIDRLLAPKVLTNFKKFDKDGEHQVSTITPDDNLIIKGNNLLALHTLKSKYAGRVKLIYIDPPYNTGNDSFNYNDSFNHSTWLAFMRNRLDVAKDLLSKDGLIFVHCDNNEQAYLKVILDEIFGRENFRETISVVNNPRGRDYGAIANMHEFIHLYSKTEQYESYSLVDENKEFPFLDDVSGFEIRELRNRNTAFNADNRRNLFYSFWLNPNKKDSNGFYEIALEDNGNGWVQVFPAKSQGIQTVWRWGQDKSRENLNINIVGKDNQNGGYQIIEKYREKSRLARSVWWDKEVNSERGTVHLKSLFDNKKVFSFPKPEELISRVLEISTRENDLVLDFHLGSGTTAAVAHKMGRRYIGIEQMDYIDAVTVERMKKVIAGEQGGISKTVNWQGGGSFIYCELAKANQTFIDQIQDAENSQKLIEIWELMQEKAFLSYRVDPKKVDLTSDDFTALSLDDQKRFLMEVMDKNMLYVPVSEIDDVTYGVSEADKTLNRQFFSKS